MLFSPPPTRLRAVLVGKTGPLSPADPRPSAIDKQPRAGRLTVDQGGLVDDEQADTEHHGGDDKAIHHYPADHYAYWSTVLASDASRARLKSMGAFGENLSTFGWTEANVCLGDIIAVGDTVRLQVSHGRQPCSKLATKFDTRDMVKRVTKTSRTGWYCRVLEGGTLAAGDAIHVLERPHPAWPLRRLFDVLFLSSPDRALLEQLAAMPVLAAAWHQRVEQRLKAAVEV